MMNHFFAQNLDCHSLQELGSLQVETSGQLASFLSHAKKAAAAGGKAGELRQQLARAEMGLKDGLNVLCCCRSIVELKAIPKGWRWSDNRYGCQYQYASGESANSLFSNDCHRIDWLSDRIKGWRKRLARHRYCFPSIVIWLQAVSFEPIRDLDTVLTII
jgi:hypothetical protein